MRRDTQAGFTLIEALVALSVLAVATTFVLSATESHSRNTIALSERMIAHWAAQNRLIRLESGMQNLPGSVALAGARWRIDSEFSATLDPDLVRAEVAVSSERDPNAVLVTLTGFLDIAEQRP